MSDPLKPIKKDQPTLPVADNQKKVSNHKKAADHFESAAKSHHEAAKHQETGDHGNAAKSTLAAHDHAVQGIETQKEGEKFNAPRS